MRRKPCRDDRGSTSLFFITIAIALFLMVGLVVDGGGKVRSLQRANAVADQAARAGGQAIIGPQAIRGDGAKLDTGSAKSAAQSYLGRSGVSGSVAIVNGTRLRVTATNRYDPVFLSLIGIGTMTSSGSAEVRLVEGIDGALS